MSKIEKLTLPIFDIRINRLVNQVEEIFNQNILLKKMASIKIPESLSTKLSVGHICVWIDFILYAKANGVALFLDEVDISKEPIHAAKLKHDNKLFSDVISFINLSIGENVAIEILHQIKVDFEKIINGYINYRNSNANKLAFLNIDKEDK